jgi:hypothetical protein
MVALIFFLLSDALAACGISSLLALEIAEPGRSAEDRRRFAGIDPADEH